MPQRLTRAQVPSRRRKPSCLSTTATTVSTTEPRKLATEYQRLEGLTQPKRLAAKAPRIASAPRTEITCSTESYFQKSYLASAWYSSLGIMPHASDMRLVKLYMLAISTTSQTSSSVSP